MERDSCGRTDEQWPTVAARRWPMLARCPEALEWLRVQADLGLASRTLEAYARGLADYLTVCVREAIDPLNAGRAEIARYVRDLVQRPSPRGTTIISIDSWVGLANATLQQRLVVVRLFYDHLIEERRRDTNPVGRGRYTPGRGFGGHRDRGLVPRFTKLPWIPTDAEWQQILVVASGESLRTRLMLALAYDAALRREELCSLRTDDVDPAYRTLRVRAETTKNRRARVVPYSAATGMLLQAYLAHRRALSAARGLLFLSESRNPVELVRALAVTWLFSGLRSDEIVRLRVGCVRWQPRADGARDRVCLLDVPAHKTGAPFTKPVDALVGQAIDAWEAVRPVQPPLLDLRTGELVAILFCLRVKRVARDYFNQALIPALCRKAGVPRTDARGRITSHRARSTIASQLYNAKEPMTLFELQAWLGHRSAQSTQHYTQITPTRLAQAYADAGYFARNLRTVEVLIDREAVHSGAAASGAPWQYFDLGHGYCTYNFFEQCPHRMACARCDFYLPKISTRAQLLEAKGHLQRMLTTIPMTEDERAAVEDGAESVEQLLNRLADTPTPAGPTPREIMKTQTPLLTITPLRRSQGA